MSNNYLIIGDDNYIKDKEAEKLKSKFLSSSEIQLNYSTYGSENIEEAMDSLGTMPFLSDKRITLIKEVDKAGNDSFVTFLKYLEKPLETSILILLSNNSFKKSKYFKKISSLVEVVKADKPDSGTIKSWIRSFLKKEGISISSNAVDLIVELKGTNTIDVKAEIDKLIAFSAGDKIDVNEVEQLVGRSVTEDVFKLADAINKKDSKWTFRILNDLYDQKKRPHEIIGYLSWYIRIMQKIVLLSGKGFSLGDIASELGYSPAYTRRLYNQSKKYSVKRIKKWTRQLFLADTDIKRGRREASLALEMLLVSLLHFRPLRS